MPTVICGSLTRQNMPKRTNPLANQASSAPGTSSRDRPIYIALLRGINVSGRKVIKMDKLRASLDQLGFSNVRTYVQSGNVVFEAPLDSAARLSRKIEQTILREFGF